MEKSKPVFTKSGKKCRHNTKNNFAIVLLENWQTKSKGRCDYVFGIGDQIFYAHMN